MIQQIVRDGWRLVTVGDVAVSIQYGHTASAKDEGPGPRFLRITDIQDGQVNWNSVPTCEISSSEVDKYRLYDGDLVFARTGATTGKSYLIRNCPIAVFASYLIRLRMRPEVNPAYVYYFFQSSDYWRQIDAGKQGIGQPNVNASILEKIKLVLPPPAEQDRIVAKVEELFSDIDAGIAALKRVKANLKRYRAAVLKAAVAGKLTEEWRKQHLPTEPADKLLSRILIERRRKWEAEQHQKATASDRKQVMNWREKYPEPIGMLDEDVPPVPSGWVWTTMDVIANLTGGITKGQKHSPETQLREVPYLRVANVQRGYLDLSEIKTIAATAEDIRDLALRPGDILFNEGGDRDKLGRGWVWNGEIPDCIHQNHVFRARLVVDGLEPKFFSHHGNAFGQQWFKRAGKQSVNLASINLSVLRRFPVPLPPIAEQRQITAEIERRLSVVDAVEAEIEQGLKRAAKLRQAILKRAFEGKLVQPQVTADSVAVMVGIAVAVEEVVKVPVVKRRQRTDMLAPAKKDPKGMTDRRAAIASYAVNALRNSPNFGRTQMEKLLHLTQTHLEVDLGLEFKRLAAGPFDEAIYKVEYRAGMKGWFTTSEQQGQCVTYRPSRNILDRCQAAEAILGDKLPAMKTILAYFAKMDTEQAELLDTVYAVWNDLILDGTPAPADKTITDGVYRWHEAKKKFDATRIQICIQWMRDHSLVPHGTGEHTRLLRQPVAKLPKRTERKPHAH